MIICRLVWKVLFGVDEMVVWLVKACKNTLNRRKIMPILANIAFWH